MAARTDAEATELMCVQLVLLLQGLPLLLRGLSGHGGMRGIPGPVIVLVNLGGWGHIHFAREDLLLLRATAHLANRGFLRPGGLPDAASRSDDAGAGGAADAGGAAPLVGVLHDPGAGCLSGGTAGAMGTGAPTLVDAPSGGGRSYSHRSWGRYQWHRGGAGHKHLGICG